MRGPHVRFCERRGGAILRAYSTEGIARPEQCLTTAANVMRPRPAPGHQNTPGRVSGRSGSNIVLLKPSGAAMPLLWSFYRRLVRSFRSCQARLWGFSLFWVRSRRAQAVQKLCAPRRE